MRDASARHLYPAQTCSMATRNLIIVPLSCSRARMTGRQYWPKDESVRATPPQSAPAWSPSRREVRNDVSCATTPHHRDCLFWTLLSLAHLCLFSFGSRGRSRPLCRVLQHPARESTLRSSAIVMLCCSYQALSTLLSQQLYL